MVVDPMTILSESGLKLIFSNPTIQSSYKKYLESGKDTDLDLFLCNFQLLSVPMSLGDDSFVKLDVKSRDSELIAAAASAGAWVNRANEGIRYARETYTNNLFAKLISWEDRSYPDLIKFANKMKEDYEKVERLIAGLEFREGVFLPTNLPVFTAKYIGWHFESKVFAERRWTVQNMMDGAVCNYVELKLSEWIECLLDFHPKLTQLMIQKFNEFFRFPMVRDFTNDYSLQVKFIRAVKMLHEARTDAQKQDEAETAKYIPYWVMAAYKAYSEFVGVNSKKTKNMPIALGFLAGNTKEQQNTAIQRYRQFVADSMEEHRQKNTLNKKLSKEW